MSTESTTEAPATIDWHVADDRAALANVLANDVAAQLRQRLSLHGVATLVVSGGSTPVDFLKALSAIELDWASVSVTLADERWVPADDADSNETLVRKHLLQGPGASATVVPLFEAGVSVEEAQPKVNDRLAGILRSRESADVSDDQQNPQGAVVVLGMGADGHTASLFPNTEGLSAALDPDTEALCIPMHPTTVSQGRMSLTLAALTSDTSLFLHITGDEKRSVLEAALGSRDVLAAPVAALFRTRAPAVYWAS